MKKLISLLLTIILIISLSACSPARIVERFYDESAEGEPAGISENESEENEPGEPIVYEPYIFDESKRLTGFDHLGYYDLNDAQKELYVQMYYGIANMELVFEIDPYWIEDEAGKGFNAVTEILGDNNPELFWHPQNYSLRVLGNGPCKVLPVYDINGKEIFAESNDYGDITYPPDEDIAEAKAWIESMQAAIKDVIDNFPVDNNMTPFEVEVAVHDWIYDNVIYDLDAPNRNSMVGTLLEGRATCEGYSYTFQYIMRLSGTECLVYSGYLREDSTVGHAWNAVKLDGEWYQIDITSNATRGGTLEEPRFHRYFNRTDEYMAEARTHLIKDEDLGFNPRIECNATEYNYYIKKDLRIDSDAAFIEKVPRIIDDAIAAGTSSFQIEFATEWAASSEISDKIMLIDPKYWVDTTFYYIDKGNIIFGRLNSSDQ